MARRRSGKKIDFVHWTLGQAISFGQAAGTVAVTLFAAQHEPETLLRIRGNMLSYLDGAIAAAGQAVRMGIGDGRSPSAGARDVQVRDRQQGDADPSQPGAPGSVPERHAGCGGSDELVVGRAVLGGSVGWQGS